MLGADGDATYVLENRSSYMRDTATYSDFTIMYSVDFNDVWLYPRAYITDGPRKHGPERRQLASERRPSSSS